MTREADRVSQDLLRSGYARVTLDEAPARLLATALRESRAFFARPTAEKDRHSTSDLNSGYRPLGHEYSITPDRPDLNECFTLWSDRTDLIPEAPAITSLTTAFLDWRAALVSFVGTVIDELARHFGADSAPPFEAASYLQVNGYTVDTAGRELLQDRHEDGHLITVVHSTGPGLEIWPGGEGPLPMALRPNEVLVMPGSVLTDLTGGRIAPLDHQVRNLYVPNRLSLMYFVNPELSAPLYPWTGTAWERATDLRERVQSRPATFGLPHVPVL